MAAFKGAEQLAGVLIAATAFFQGSLVCAQQPSAEISAQPPSPPAALSNLTPNPAAPGVALPIEGWNSTLDNIDSRLTDPAINENAIEAVRNELNDLRTHIEAYIREQRPNLPELEARLQKLGDAPAEGDPPEPQPVADQRAELKKSIGDLTGALKAAGEALVRLDALSSRAREQRRAIFESRTLERGRTPLSPFLWRDIAKDAPLGLTRMSFMLSHWWDGLQNQNLFLGIILAAIALWGALSVFARYRIRRLRRWAAPELPPEWRRAASAGRVILLRILPTVAAGGFLYFGLSEAGLLSPAAERLVIAAIASLIIIATVQAVTKTALAIVRPKWRLLKLSDPAARKLYARLMILAAIYGIDFFISAASQAAFMPFSVSVGQSFISSVLIAALIISILRIKEDRGAGAEPSPIGPSYIRIPLLFIALTILGTALIGYVSLARFIAGQLIVTSTILIIAYLLIIWVSAFGQSLSDERTVAGTWIQTSFGLNERGRERLSLPVILVLKAAIIIGVVPFILLLWGFDWHDIASWVRQALFGFEIGGLHISITSIIVALILFVLGYTAAKFFQGWLDRYVLERASVDPGVRDSVRTGVGYFGVVLAALLAVSYLGLDFSNLAIVAGALSVGVGFGLQSIVNNFVSGLILLAERPIKAGDWIIVGGHEGIVRKISVRSTEIETFDRANVVIPNSMLISDTVKNWTLHNDTGRMPIAVGVHYDSDPEKVRDILLEVARQHPQVLSVPEPFVFFEDFGDSALNFILFVYLANVNRSFAVRTDLRIAILKAFRQNGIEIPYPQTDVHLRDLDWIKTALRKRASQVEDKGAMSVRDYVSESQAPNDGEGNGH